MDLEHLIRIPYDKNSHFQFYEYENGTQKHRIRYEYFKMEGTNLIIATKVHGSEEIIADKCEKGYQNWF